MEPCEIGAEGDTTGDSALCVDVATRVDWEIGIGVSGERRDQHGTIPSTLRAYAQPLLRDLFVVKTDPRPCVAYGCTRKRMPL